MNEYNIDELLPKAVAHFHELVVHSIRKSNKASETGSGLFEQLAEIGENIKRIRYAIKAGKDNPIKIGLFGSTNRGKSSLINVLAGVKILPEKPIPGWTRTSIELQHSDELSHFEIIVTEDDDRFERQNFHDISEAYDHLLAFSGNSKKSNPKKINVIGPFNNSHILKSGRILVDTPGVEKIIDGSQMSEKNDNNKNKISSDTKQALATLNSTHAVIFCLRADQLGNANDNEFYLNHLRKRLPLNVIGFRDKTPEMSNEDIEEEAKMKYHTKSKKFFVISAKNEMKKIIDDSSKSTSNGENNLDKLTGAINNHIKSLQNGNEISEFYIDYKKILTDAKYDIQPPRIREIEFINLLKKIAEFKEINWASTILKYNNLDLE